MVLLRVMCMVPMTASWIMAVKRLRFGFRVTGNTARTVIGFQSKELTTMTKLRGRLPLMVGETHCTVTISMLMDVITPTGAHWPLPREVEN